MRKSKFCLCKNKGADQLRSYCEAEQHLSFHYTVSTNPLVLKSDISSFQPPSVAAQAGLCETWSETLKTVFLMSRLNYKRNDVKKNIVPVKNLPFQQLLHAVLVV